MNSFLYGLGQFLLETVGYTFSVSAPILLVFYFFVRQIRTMKIDLLIITGLFSSVPMLTPALTKLLGFQYFTAMNYDLQRNEGLIISSVILVSVFTITLVLGGRFSSGYSGKEGERVVFPVYIIAGIFLLNFVLMGMFLESDTVLSKGYGLIKQQTNPYSSLVNQFFNGCVALFLTYIAGKERRIVIQFIYLSFIILSLLMARRTLAVGLAMLMLYSMGTRKIGVKKVILIFVGLALLWFIGEARSVGVLSFISGGGVGVKRSYFSMPGGGANIFMSVMGVVDLINSGVLKFPETTPVFLWPEGIAESDIYSQYGYQYNGGMHLATVLYWNFGLIGVLVGGFLLGVMVKRAGDVLLRVRSDKGGSLAAMLSAAFVITLPNTMWYSPIAVLKLMGAVILGFALAIIVKRASIGIKK